MKKLTIEWKHYDKEGETCTRCNNTGENIKRALVNISTDPKFKGIKIIYKETKLEASQMSESNIVLVNGQLLEDILNATASENHCHSCTCLAGKDTDCRTINLNDKIYEDIPEKLIIRAILLKLEGNQ